MKTAFAMLSKSGVAPMKRPAIMRWKLRTRTAAVNLQMWLWIVMAIACWMLMVTVFVMRMKCLGAPMWKH